MYLKSDLKTGFTLQLERKYFPVRFMYSFSGPELRRTKRKENCPPLKSEKHETHEPQEESKTTAQAEQTP